MISKIIQEIINVWDNLELNGKVPRKFRPLIANGKFGKVNIFIFFDNNELPTLLMRIAKTKSANANLQNEYLQLKKIHLFNDSFLTGSVPRPVYYNEIDGQGVLIELNMVGKALTSLIHRQRNGLPNIRDAQKYFDLCFNWITHLYQFFF